jgi:hypothetical protein
MKELGSRDVGAEDAGTEGARAGDVDCRADCGGAGEWEMPKQWRRRSFGCRA